jgi:hypothetical protein
LHLVLAGHASTASISATVAACLHACEGVKQTVVVFHLCNHCHMLLYPCRTQLCFTEQCCAAVHA